ncbi:MAG: hypothetical protein RL654_3599 [Pseudomonadota bacterium]
MIPSLSHVASARDACGVFTICPTPFAEDGRVDLHAIDRLVALQAATGVAGLAVLGFLGEAHKLSNAERDAVLRRYLAAAGSLPVWVGVRALGTAGAVEQAMQAQDLGAAAVFAAPLDGASDALQFDHYAAIARAVRIPVVIHDFPASFETEIRPEVVARLALEGGVDLIKMEEPPVGQKISRIRALSGDRVRIFGGLGGVYFFEELQRGAVGTMTGFAFPEVLVAIHRRHAAGDVAGAAALFDRYLPLIRYEFQPRIGLALRKHVYLRRGVLGSDHLRAPGMTLDPVTRQELEATVARVGLRLDVRGPQTIDLGGLRG